MMKYINRNKWKNRNKNLRKQFKRKTKKKNAFINLQEKDPSSQKV